MGRLVELNHVYKRKESFNPRFNNLGPTVPSIEIIGDISARVDVYASNLPPIDSPLMASGLKLEYELPPIANVDIETGMSNADSGLRPGFHPTCVRSTWIAFIAPVGSPLIYEEDVIDWEYEERVVKQLQNC